MSTPATPTYPCPTCGAANAAYARFCGECGEPLDGPPSTPGPAPSPPRSAPPWQRLELWLGALLALAVLGFAAWDWWHSEDQAAGYRAGAQAVAAHDWDAAAAAFGRLGDYRDAARQATEAQAQVQRRNTSYQAGVAAGDRQEWLAAYRALSQTLAIQPGYRDSATRYEQARRQATTAALTGTLTFQTTGPAPGWYVAGADPAHQLPGTDARSQIWATNPVAGRIIYDGPTPGSPPNTSNFPGPAPGQLLWPGRQLWLAGLAPGDPPAVVLPPSLGLWGVLRPAPGGVWWYTSDNVTSRWASYGDLPGPVEARPNFWLSRLRYYDAATGTLTDRLPPGDVTVLDYQPATGGLLLGIYDLAAPDARQTRLVRLAPDGSSVVVAEVPGLILQAGLRPDGMALFYVVATGTTNPARSLDLVWRDLRAPAPPRTLDVLALAGFQPLAGIQAVWVPGPAPRLLVRRAAPGRGRDPGPTITLSVFNLLEQTENVRWQGPLDTFQQGDYGAGERYTLAPDGQSVFYLLPEADHRWRPVWQALDGSRATPAFAPLPADSGTLQQVAWLPGNAGLLLSFSNTHYDFFDQRNTFTVYRLTADHSDAPPALLLQTEYHSGDNLPLAPLLPSGYLAWPTGADGQHLRPPDGDGDLPLLDGIVWIWPLQPAPVVLAPLPLAQFP